MKKGDILEGTVEQVLFPNVGLVPVEDKIVKIKNTIAGQHVRFSISKKSGGKYEGRLLEVLQSSPQETRTCCPHFPDCGGCYYQKLPYEYQLSQKLSQVKRLLMQAGIEYELEEIIPSPKITEYRNKMEFSFGDSYKDGPLALGMHKRGSFYDIVDVPQCEIIDGDFRQILTCVITYYRERQVSFYHKMHHTGYLRHLLVRKGAHTGEILVVLVTSSLENHEDNELVSSLLKLNLDGKIVGILHTFNDSLADVVHNDSTKLLYGRDYFYEKILGQTFKISPFSFFQTNSLGAELLYQKAREYVGDAGNDKVIYDLYSGTGTIAQILAPAASKVIGVEIVEEAVKAARENALQNGLTNCAFVSGDVGKVLDEVKEKPDYIVLDPPREGVSAKALGKILSYHVPQILYISCKPTSLARDLAFMQSAGYHVTRGCLVDMFPFTANVETVVALHRTNS